MTWKSAGQGNGYADPVSWETELLIHFSTKWAQHISLKISFSFIAFYLLTSLSAENLFIVLSKTKNSR